MQNLKATPKAKAPKTAKAVAPVATDAKAPTARETHAANGVTAKHYAGLSAYLNANRKPRVTIYTGRKPASLTPRMLATLRAMRDAYGTKHFAARGFDNAVISHLASAGMLRLIDGTGLITGDLATDGAKPLALTVTADGQKYGKA